MATLYTAAKAGATVPAKRQEGTFAVRWTYAITAALVINDVIQMGKVPAGGTVITAHLIVDDLDSNGSPAVVLALGDGDVVNRYISASTVGQNGGTQAPNTNTYPYTYPAEDTIDVKVTTAPATSAVTGNITVWALISMDP